MIEHTVRVYPSAEPLPQSEQLAWKLAEVATVQAPLDPNAVEMVANRVIDNAAVALGAINRAPVRTAREQALAHPRNEGTRNEGARSEGACLFGISNNQRFDAEWAAWANGVAVRELDMHDTYLAADYSHPADNLPPLFAVAQQLGIAGEDLVRGALAAYEIQIALVRGICLHEHKKDHIAHLCPAQAAGIGAMLGLSTEVVYQAIQQAVHVSFATRQSRKGEISSWKAFAPAHAGKLAVEAVDRAMRGERSPSPIYEGEDSVLAYMLDGKQAEYTVALPEPIEPRRAILDSYTKQHSAEYQAQALIDLAFRMQEKIASTDEIESVTIHTSHHTHRVIGTGAGDPQKLDPTASRETLDHSIMYIFAVALQDGQWHHVNSYTPERAGRKDTVRLWQRVKTVEDASWTARYHDPDPNQRAFGGRVVIQFAGGDVLEDELAVANAHPAGPKPFAREGYLGKFQALTEGVVPSEEQLRFLGLCQRLPELSAAEVRQLNVQLPQSAVESSERNNRGVF